MKTDDEQSNTSYSSTVGNKDDGGDLTPIIENGKCKGIYSNNFLYKESHSKTENDTSWCEIVDDNNGLGEWLIRSTTAAFNEIDDKFLSHKSSIADPDYLPFLTKTRKKKLPKGVEVFNNQCLILSILIGVYRRSIYDYIQAVVDSLIDQTANSPSENFLYQVFWLLPSAKLKLALAEVYTQRTTIVNCKNKKNKAVFISALQ